MEQHVVGTAGACLLATFSLAQGGCPVNVTDVDGQVYPVVRIGDQCWTARNLRTAHYANGDVIANVTDDFEWADLDTGAWCTYANDPGNDALYGKLYNWHAVNDARMLCPTGWHVPSDLEWMDLEASLGMQAMELAGLGWRGENENVGGQLKDTVLWVGLNNGATNTTGFSAWPGGLRYVPQGSFLSLGEYGYWWTATSDNVFFGWHRTLRNIRAGLSRGADAKEYGFSVRCVYDQLVGIEEENDRNLASPFPNPTAGRLQLDWRDSGTPFSLVDPMGRVVYSGRLLRGLNTFDLASLAPGLYLLRIDGAPGGALRVIKE